MCLPTLPSYVELKKVNFNQDYYRAKSNQDFNRNQQLTNAKNFFKDSSAQTRQYSQWSSAKTFNASMHAYSRQLDESDERKEQKRAWMLQRQQKLKQLIADEAKEYEASLKRVRTGGAGAASEYNFVHDAKQQPQQLTTQQPARQQQQQQQQQQIGSSRIPNFVEPVNLENLDAVKSRIDSIKSARESERKQLADVKLYENWRANNPEIRQIEANKARDHVVESWHGQKEAKRAEHELKTESDKEYAAYLACEQQKAADQDVELRRLKLSREIELKEILKEQMIELKQREAESEILAREEAELAREHVRLKAMSEQRERVNAEQAKQEYGRQLLRQHKAKLRVRANEVRQALQLDLEILRSLTESEHEAQRAVSAKRVQARADAQEMLRVLNEQMRLEQQREAEVDSMFADEAVKEWSKRQAEWERERLAREKLMRQVLAERREQCVERAEFLRAKKEASLRKREDLIADMEKTQAMAARERLKVHEAKQEQRVALDEQLTARREQALEKNVVAEVADYEEEQIEKEKRTAFLHQEKEKTAATNFQPKTFGRRKVAWD